MSITASSFVRSASASCSRRMRSLHILDRQAAGPTSRLTTRSVSSGSCRICERSGEVFLRRTPITIRCFRLIRFHSRPLLGPPARWSRASTIHRLQHRFLPGFEAVVLLATNTIRRSGDLDSTWLTVGNLQFLMLVLSYSAEARKFSGLVFRSIRNSVQRFFDKITKQLDFAMSQQSLWHVGNGFPGGECAHKRRAIPERRTDNLAEANQFCDDLLALKCT